MYEPGDQDKTCFFISVKQANRVCFFYYKGEFSMHELNQSCKKRIRKDAIEGARLYQKYLVPNTFLIVTEDGKSKEVCFNKKDFAHLVGVRSSLNDLDFYNHCIQGTLVEDNINVQQHYDFGTIRKKIVRIKKINKIMYANADTNLILINLHTNTVDFPLAIESPKDKMVVAFTGNDNHARSLRNNNQTNFDEKKKIIAIFSKKRDSKEKYTQLVYLKDYQILKDMYEEFDENISVDLLNDYEKNIEN